MLIVIAFFCTIISSDCYKRIMGAQVPSSGRSLPLLFFTVGNAASSQLPTYSNQDNGVAYPASLAVPELTNWVSGVEPAVIQQEGPGGPGGFRDPSSYAREEIYLKITAKNLNFPLAIYSGTVYNKINVCRCVGIDRRGEFKVLFAQSPAHSKRLENRVLRN